MAFGGVDGACVPRLLPGIAIVVIIILLIALGIVFLKNTKKINEEVMN